MLAQRSPQMRKAVGVLKELSADERTRMLYEEREIARRDMTSRMEGAERKARVEIAQSMLADAAAPEFVSKHTGLTLEEVESLNPIE